MNKRLRLSLFRISGIYLTAAVLSCHASNYYVNKSAAGSNSGADWTNAWNELDQINWASILPGDTIWVAGGTYVSQLIPQASGTSGARINIMRVLSADVIPTTAAGWDSSFDSQVIINPSVPTNPGIAWNTGIDTTGSYVTINGRIDTGASCGIQVNVADGSSGGAIKMDTGNTGVVVQHVDIAGPGGSTPFTYSSNLSALYAVVHAGRGTIIGPSFVNCRIHGAVNAALIGGVDSITLQYCKFYDVAVQNSATYHPNVLYTTGSTGNLIFSYNEVWNWDSEGIFLKNTSQTWYIYENLFHDSVGAGRAVQADDTSHTVFFYANTLVNVQFSYLGDASSGGVFTSNSQSRNNIYWNVPGAPSGIADEDYGYTDGNYLLGSNATNGGNNPFVDYTAEDYRVISTVGPKYPCSVGAPLPAEYGPDFAGNPRPANPSPWDVGAFQSLPVAPIASAELPTAQATSSGAGTSSIASAELPTTQTANSSAGASSASTEQIANSNVPAGSTLQGNLTGNANAVAFTARLTNLSARASTSSGANSLTAGFVISGGSMAVLLRGVAPTLGQFGETDAIADPQLTLNSGSLQILANSGWGGSPTLAAAFSQVGAFALPASSKDDAILSTLQSGAYTAQLSSVSGSTGIALAEIYDADPENSNSSSRLVNVSARANVGTGDKVLIVGFVVDGTGTEKVLIRAIGPTLASFGVSGSLAAPQIVLSNSNGTLVASNTVWGGTAALVSAFTNVGAFALPPTSSDSALLVTLAPGAYTAEVSGTNGTSGIALVEVYEVPN
jgi:hypothetical protein